MSSSWFTLAADAGLGSLTGNSSDKNNNLTKSVLNDATSDDLKPTPGYLYDEIALATNDPEINSRLIDYLIQRLKKQSPYTKMKVLKIIRKVCYKGHVEFRRAWQRNVSIVKEHEMFKGVPDTLRGDEPNKAVREAAKEAVEAIFDTAVERHGSQSALASRIKGYGNTAIPEPSYSESYSENDNLPLSSSSSSRTAAGRYSSDQPVSYPQKSGKTKYEGIGNPNFRDPRNEPKSFLETVTEKVKEKVEKYSAEAATAVANASAGNSMMANMSSSKPSWMEGGSGVNGYGYASNRGPNSQISSTGSYDPSKFSTMPSTSNGGPWNSNGYSSNRVRKTESDPRSPKNSMPTVMGIASSSSNFGSAASDGKYEQTLIDNLCPPGGIKAVPPADKLSEFCTTCKSLNPNIVMPILLEKLIHDDWKVQHKALCVCEAILGTKGCESFGDYIDNNIELIEGLIKSPSHSSVKERAKKVWSLLYEGEYEDINPTPASNSESAPKPSQPSSTSKAKVQEPEVNLLDLSSEDSGVPAPNPSSTATNGKSSGDAINDSLFSNLEVKSSSSSANQTSSQNVNKNSNDIDLLFLGSEPAAPEPTAASSGFSFLSQPTPAQSQNVNASSSIPLASLYAAPMTGGLISQQPPQVLIPNMSAAPTIPASSGAASSFSFLSNPSPAMPQQTMQTNIHPVKQPVPMMNQQPIQQVTNQFSGISLQNSFLSSNIDQFQSLSHASSSSLPVKTSLNGQVISQQPISNIPAKQQTQTIPQPAIASKPISNPSIDDSFSFVKDQMKASTGSISTDSQIGKKSKA